MFRGGIGGNAAAFMLQVVFSFSAKDSEAFYTCVGVRNVCARLYRL